MAGVANSWTVAIGSNCVWATGTSTASAGPKNGATNLAASLTALALGAAVLAF